MILFFYEPQWSMPAIVVYACVVLPIIQIKRALVSIVGLILCRYHHPFELSDPLMDINSEKMTHSIDLSMRRYGDLKSNHQSDDDEACSVCLVKFESEDMVSQTSKCSHVFHTICINKWVDKGNSTCPLCRSRLLMVHGGNCHARPYGIIST